MAPMPVTAYRRDVPNDLAQKIYRARRNMGLNQADFAARLNVNQATVSRWESGATPDIMVIHQIAELTGLDVASFISADLQSVTTGPRLYVKGDVAAGVWREAVEWDRSDWISYQGGSHVEAPAEARFGLVVTGESMNEVYPPGTILDCVSCVHANVDEVQNGQRVIVVRRRADDCLESTVKEFLRTDDGVWLVPRSHNPAFQQPISLMNPGDGIVEIAITAVVKGSYRPEP